MIPCKQPIRQVSELFQLIFQSISKLNQFNHRKILQISTSIQTNLKLVQKFINFQLQFVETRERKISELEAVKKTIQTKLATAIYINSKLKQDVFQLTNDLIQKENQILRLNVLNKLDCSYESSILFKDSFNESNLQIDVKSYHSYDDTRQEIYSFPTNRSLDEFQEDLQPIALKKHKSLEDQHQLPSQNDKFIKQ